jgi:nucleoside-diphosphate-sugar epimerase
MALLTKEAVSISLDFCYEKCCPNCVMQLMLHVTLLRHPIRQGPVGDHHISQLLLASKLFYCPGILGSLTPDLIVQVNSLSRHTFKLDYAPIITPGLAEWDHVHIHDLGHFFVLAVDAALDSDLSKNPEIFGRKGYFFVEAGSHVWAEVAKWVGEECLKRQYIKPRADGEPVTKEVTAEELNYSTLGFNSKGVAARARKYLGWEPKGESLKDAVPEIVRIEAEISKVA